MNYVIEHQSVFVYLCILMKKCFFLICFLLILSQCHDHEDRTLRMNKAPQKKTLVSKLSKKARDGITSHDSGKPLEKPEKLRKSKTKKISPSPDIKPMSLTPHQDSLSITKINFLRSSGLDLDINEPLIKNFLNSGLSPAHFPPVIALSRESFLKINFDNDILDYTDRFYTNGIRIDLISPFLSGNPINKLLLPYWGAGTNYYGLSLVQNMFTPSTTKVGGILYDDRPYAAYLFLGSYKITNDPIHKFRQTSGLDLGVIGPYSFGEWVQRSFHNSVPTNNEPLGWEYQIQNDVVIDYHATLEKGIINTRAMDFNLVTSASLGTLYTNVSGGFLFRAGWMNPYFANLGIANRSSLKRAGLRKFQFIFFLKGSGELVGYDATLEGGLLNRSSVYTLGVDQITRMVFHSSAGFTITLNGFRIDAAQYLLSPEFKHEIWHKWVHIGMTFCL